MLRKVLSLASALLMLPLLALPLQAQAEEFKEGVHYTKLSKQARTQDPKRVEVVEMFGYWCPHCNTLERYLAPWKAKQDSSVVDFKHIPVSFRPNQIEFAKAYYVAKELGVEDEVHPALFNLIHRQRQWINNQEQLGEFFADFGVKEADFNKAYGSFNLNSKINRGKKKAREYGIQGVPSIIVNGKYLVTADKAGSQKAMMQVVDQLVAQEQAKLN